ncbi:MAG TPA: glycosyltransferase [Gammaproteobacteria bacterium]|nr:glycosyltransferase [Gammaproteobacteria bacterium]
MDISVVIPAYNEEQFISDTIRSINKWMPDQFDYEIIVVDHGSSDRTSALAVSAGATVIDGSALKTIAALRNAGVKNSSGRVLVFIDADITLTAEWSRHISRVIKNFDGEPFRICGSHPKIPEQSGLLMKRWFEPKSEEESPTHIGSCHLITSRALFEQVNGFPEHMETSEEFNFCVDATRAGARIISFPELVITHHGAPKTLMNFIKSEIWHGRGDWTGLSTVLSSKVAMLTLMFIALHLLLLVLIVTSREQVTVITLVSGSIIGLCFLSSSIKFSRHGFTYVLFNTYTFYFYFLARSLSLFSALFTRSVRKRSR